MDKFSLIIGDAEQPLSNSFDLVIGHVDVEHLLYHRKTEGDYQLPAIRVSSQAIEVHIASAAVDLYPVVLKTRAVDQKNAECAVDLHLVQIGAKAVEEKPDRTAVGHVYLHWAEIRSRIIEPVFCAGAVSLYPLEIKGLRAYDEHFASAEATLRALEIRARGDSAYPERIASGTVCLRAPEINGVIIEPVEGVGAVSLWPIEIGAHAEDAETNKEASGNVRLPLLMIKARTRYVAPASGCVLVPCSMTGRDLIRRFRELSQDEVEPYLWEDCFVLNMLNEAEREAADRAKLLYDDSLAVAVTVTAGKARYDIDPHIIDIERAALTADGDGRPPLQLKMFDRMELDWRTPPRSQHEAGLPWGRPFGLVYDGTQTVEIVPRPRRDGRLLLGVHRLPWATFDIDDEPEIPCIHHLALVDWALFRAFSIPDADEANEQLATYYHDRFEKYFGRRIDAKKRRTQRMNKQHVNKLW